MSSKQPQSTNTVFMIEPGAFFANPETMETNAYQVDDHEPKAQVSAAALKEYEDFKAVLEGEGVNVVSTKGLLECPDMVFPNWFFTHASGELILCPMLNENRQAERVPEIIDILKARYSDVLDWTAYEDDGRALESTASIVSDHINKKCYSGLSARTDEGLVRQWAEHRGYDVEIFKTQSHAGVPVYHTDCVMWIGSTLAGICPDCIVEEDRERIVSALKDTHEVVIFSDDQLRTFCGNALEVIGAGGKRMLAISQGAYDSLDTAQLELINAHFDKCITSPLPTLEKYGGGSARCMLAELF